MWDIFHFKNKILKVISPYFKLYFNAISELRHGNYREIKFLNVIDIFGNI